MSGRIEIVPDPDLTRALAAWDAMRWQQRGTFLARIFDGLDDDGDGVRELCDWAGYSLAEFASQVLEVTS